jgi:hypothetical protein
MNYYSVVPEDNRFPARYNQSGESPKDAAIRYGMDWPDAQIVTVRDDHNKATRFRLSLHTAPGWGAGTSWHSVIATEIRPEELQKALEELP